MSKRLIALSLALLLSGGAAAAIIATDASAQAPNQRNPVMLAQNAQTPAPPRGPAARGPARPAPTAAQRSERRAAMCQEVYARAAGRFAALEVRLNLTGAQVPAFARWRDLRLAAAKSRATECAARPLPGGRGANTAPPSPVERLTREETLLQRRLSDIQAERPALEALYAGLDATQRQTLARQSGASRGGRGGFGRPGLGPRGGMMMMRRGPMRGPMGRGNPPPPQ